MQPATLTQASRTRKEWPSTSSSRSPEHAPPRERSALLPNPPHLPLNVLKEDLLAREAWVPVLSAQSRGWESRPKAPEMTTAPPFPVAMSRGSPSEVDAARKHEQKGEIKIKLVQRVKMVSFV